MTMAQTIQILALLVISLHGLATLGVIALIFLAGGRSSPPLSMPGKKKRERKEQQEEEVRTQERSEAGEILE